MIPYGQHEVTPADIEAVVDVLKSERLTQGPAVPRFEHALASYCGVPHAVAANSATSALHLACLALGLEPGDHLWTTPITFVASANCAKYCGASVDFVDIDPRTYNMSPKHLAEKLQEADQKGTLPKIIIPVHLAGQSCEMAEISRIAKTYDVRIIEDASHAVGGRYEGEPVGSCRYSDITIFSFHPVKIITTGEGGVAVTANARYAKDMFLLRSHGVTRDPAQMEHFDGPWYYEQIDLGFNYRMTDLQAALGTSQLGRLDQIVDRRRELAARYDEKLADMPMTTPWEHPDVRSSFHLYVIRLDLESIEPDRRTVFERLRSDGIGVNLHYIPVYRHPYYRNLLSTAANFPEAESYYAEAITIPLYPGLSNGDQDTVISALTRSLRR